MENLKQYDLQAKVGRGGHLYTKEIESPTGRYYLVDEVKAREEARKITLTELREKFEKIYKGCFLEKNSFGTYLNEGILGRWYGFWMVSKTLGILKDDE